MAGQQQIKWCPIADGNFISFEGTAYTAVRAAMKTVFGEFPIRLSKEKHTQVLQAMHAVAKQHGGGHKPYDQLLDALQRYRELEVTDV